MDFDNRALLESVSQGPNQERTPVLGTFSLGAEDRKVHRIVQDYPIAVLGTRAIGGYLAHFLLEKKQNPQT